MPDTYTWNGESWTDSKGKPVSGDEVGAYLKSKSYSVTDPSSVPDKVVSALGKALPRGAMTTVGGELGAAAGALGGPAAPVTVPLGAAVGAGIGNLAGKYLPEQIGGTPNESNTSAFMWGAGPETVGRAIGGLAEGHYLKGGASEAYDNIIKGLEDVPSGAEGLENVGAVLNRPSLNHQTILTGDNLTDSTHQFRMSVVGGLNRERERLGQTIGDAYDQLKYNNEGISEAEAERLADVAKSINERMISPSPKAASTFKKIQSYRPPKTVNEEPDLSEFESNPELKAAYEQWGTAERQKLPDVPEYKAPTLDELRDLRQQVNQKMRMAGGGDKHALLNLQGALDGVLLPHLPDDIQRSRGLYAGFLSRYPWKDINRLNSMGTTREVSDYVFGGTPERAAELMQWAGPKDKPILKEAFIDRALSRVDTNLPPEKQMDQIRQALGPYMSNGVAQRVLGMNAKQDLQNILYTPMHRIRLAQMMNTPESKKAFTDAWVSAARGSKDKMEAAQLGLKRVIESLPPAEQRALANASSPQVVMPQLQSTEQSIAGRLGKGAQSSMIPYAKKRVGFGLPYGAARVAMGSPGGAAYAGAIAMAFAGYAASSAAYQALMDRGGAQFLAKLYSSKSGRDAARYMFEALANIGAGTVEQAQAAKQKQIQEAMTP